MSQIKDFLTDLTQEQRQQMRIKAKETREANKLWAQENLVQCFGDDEVVWRELASKAGIRLPAKYIPSSNTKHIKKALKKLDISMAEWLDVEAARSLKEFSMLNPTWPALGHVGLLLEYWEEKNNEIHTTKNTHKDY